MLSYLLKNLAERERYSILTLDPEEQLVGDGLALCVKRGAGVPPAAVPRHLLQHEALVAVEHARRRVVRQWSVLEQQRRSEGLG